MKFNEEIALRGPFTWQDKEGNMRLSFQLVEEVLGQRYVLNIKTGKWQPYNAESVFGDEVQFEIDPAVFHKAIHAFEAGKESIEGRTYTQNEDGSVRFEPSLATSEKP